MHYDQYRKLHHTLRQERTRRYGAFLLAWRSLTFTMGSCSRFLPELKPKMAWRTALGLPLPLRMDASALACEMP